MEKVILESKSFEYKIGAATREITIGIVNDGTVKMDIICWGDWFSKTYKRVTTVLRKLREEYSLNDAQLAEIESYINSKNNQ
ncbi:MAG: hypothetical protein ACRC0G_07935 [Fusobacteriaceae bacterium]